MRSDITQASSANKNIELGVIHISLAKRSRTMECGEETDLNNQYRLKDQLSKSFVQFLFSHRAQVVHNVRNHLHARRCHSLGESCSCRSEQMSFTWRTMQLTKLGMPLGTNLLNYSNGHNNKFGSIATTLLQQFSPITSTRKNDFNTSSKFNLTHVSFSEDFFWIHNYI